MVNDRPTINDGMERDDRFDQLMIAWMFVKSFDRDRDGGR